MPLQHALHQRVPVTALAQGWQSQRQAIQAPVQVGTKTAGSHLFLQVPVGGADQRKIHRHGLPAAQRHHLALLQHTQQAGLHGQRHVADLVQKQGSAVRLADAAGGPLAPCPGIGTGRVSKQFRLDQVFRKGGAVHRHKGLPATLAAGMDGLGQHLLARAGFPMQQHCNRLVQHLACFLEHAVPGSIAGIKRLQRIGFADRGACRHVQRAGARPALLHPHMQLRHGWRTQAAHAHGRRIAVAGAQQLFAVHIHYLVQSYPSQLAGTQVEQGQCRLVGSHQHTRFRQGQHPLGQRADSFRQRMHVQPHMPPVARLEQPVLDHLRGCAHHAEGMRMPAAALAGHVEHTQHAAIGRHHRRGSAGEKAVALQKVFAPMHDHWHSLGQRRAHGIGAAVLLMPGSSRHQCHTLGTRHEARITQGMQQQTIGISQQQNAAAATRLPVQVFHHRACMGEQFVLALGGALHLETREVRHMRAGSEGIHTSVQAAPPRARHMRQRCGQQILGQCVPLVKRMAGAAQQGL